MRPGKVMISSRSRCDEDRVHNLVLKFLREPVLPASKPGRFLRRSSYSGWPRFISCFFIFLMEMCLPNRIQERHRPKPQSSKYVHCSCKPTSCFGHLQLSKANRKPPSRWIKQSHPPFLIHVIPKEGDWPFWFCSEGGSVGGSGWGGGYTPSRDLATWLSFGSRSKPRN